MRSLSATTRYEDVIRRSRFIAHAGRVRTLKQTLEFFEAVADPQATHNCWAWRLDHQYRFNDDGEPSGSAGRPILAAIEGQQLDQVMIVVSRHFGGTKLGIGGLVRAYGGTAAKCLDQSDIVEVLIKNDYRLHVEFALADRLHHLLDRFEIEKRAENYDSEGLTLDVRLAENRLAEFRRSLAEISRGHARLERLRPPR
jgi:uncharacterized YigZ family protein